MAGVRTTKLFASAAALAVAAIVAGCGSSGSSTAGNSSGASPSPAASGASGSSATGASVGAAKGPDGTYLVGPSGRALYLWVADTSGQSVCSGSCAKVWPPLLTKTSPVASSGVTGGDLGIIIRSDGTKQVTYKGHPLYYFVADHAAGIIKGQGSNSFGAKWWLVAPSGAAITAAGSSAGPPAKSSSSGGGSSSGAGSSGGGSSGGGSGWG